MAATQAISNHLLVIAATLTPTESAWPPSTAPTLAAAATGLVPIQVKIANKGIGSMIKPVATVVPAHDPPTLLWISSASAREFPRTTTTASATGQL